MALDSFLHALVSYFVIIDPLGTAVIFYGLAGGEERTYVVRMALRAVAFSIAIVLAFGFFGEVLLTKLGISIESLRVAGGLLLFYTAFHMITQGRTPTERPNETLVDISVFPLSIPLIAGPGCLTLTILLFSKSTGPAETTGLVLALLTVYALTLAMLLGSTFINHLIGEAGDDILRRLLGVILAALAIQFIADGIRQLAC